MSESVSTNRYTYRIDRNPQSYRPSDNTLTIKDNVGKENAHDTGVHGTSTFGTTMVMTVQEAKVLQKFLNENLDSGESAEATT